jgi:hypothetical protein
MRAELAVLGRDVERLTLADAVDTTETVVLAVLPAAPESARLERAGTRFRLYQPSGDLRAEIAPSANGFDVKTFDTQGRVIPAQAYLMPSARAGTRSSAAPFEASV